MNRADRMLEVLRDGRPHTRKEIFARAGFMLTNNAATELRERNFDVRQTRERVNGQVVYSYRLHYPAMFGVSLDERDGTDGIPSDSAGPESSRSSSESLPDGTDQSPVDLLTEDDDGKHDRTGGGRSVSSESEQESLFTLPRSPAWS